jgi:two-component system chemotaxis response regulator CheB
LLTGMGHDGSDAFTEIKKRGGRTIAESEDSAVVYGMPAELVKKGGASLVLVPKKLPRSSLPGQAVNQSYFALQVNLAGQA